MAPTRSPRSQLPLRGKKVGAACKKPSHHAGNGDSRCIPCGNGHGRVSILVKPANGGKVSSDIPKDPMCPFCYLAILRYWLHYMNRTMRKTPSLAHYLRDLNVGGYTHGNARAAPTQLLFKQGNEWKPLVLGTMYWKGVFGDKIALNWRNCTQEDARGPLTHKVLYDACVGQVKAQDESVKKELAAEQEAKDAAITAEVSSVFDGLVDKVVAQEEAREAATPFQPFTYGGFTGKMAAYLASLAE